MPIAGLVYYAETKAADSRYPPLVLIHGAGGSHLDWPHSLRRLPDTRVIALDLPGHGKSKGAGRDDTLAYARDVCDLLAALGIERAIIAGHSMGGAIAQQIGLHTPERTAGLILIGTGSKLPVDPTLSQRIIDEPEPTIRWIVDWSWSTDAAPELKELSRQRMSETSPQVLRSDYHACQSFDVRDEIEHITAPTLVIGSKGDNMVKFKFSVTLAERIPHATLITLEKGGHMIPQEHPQAVAQAVITWLAAQDW